MKDEIINPDDVIVTFDYSCYGIGRLAQELNGMEFDDPALEEVWQGVCNGRFVVILIPLPHSILEPTLIGNFDEKVTVVDFWGFEFETNWTDYLVSARFNLNCKGKPHTSGYVLEMQDIRNLYPGRYNEPV